MATQDKKIETEADFVARQAKDMHALVGLAVHDTVNGKCDQKELIARMAGQIAKILSEYVRVD